ncbi:transcriptional regulator [Cohnella rhizosphaerae]|uniref:Helix-turn-helix domain-containing protein n=1 Tax=Cohnella rhizosphaerae TaxID=1457232 RepID=A0A9X4KYM5_9BACL|nr:transcriptional regulator [Cohnella rhizosphaerae]MDG0813660.1 helix-turn-helix domain-containing protein [Cohnella rhizosphaerae]
MDQLKRRLRELRKALGMTMAELAGSIAVSPGNVGDWESEKRNSVPSAGALIAIGNELGVSLDWLLLGIGSPFLSKKPGMSEEGGSGENDGALGKNFPSEKTGIRPAVDELLETASRLEADDLAHVQYIVRRLCESTPDAGGQRRPRD